MTSVDRQPIRQTVGLAAHSDLAGWLASPIWLADWPARQQQFVATLWAVQVGFAWTKKKKTTATTSRQINNQLEYLRLIWIQLSPAGRAHLTRASGLF